MPTFETVNLTSEKSAVVIEIGSAYTKCGFAGENAPRCIIPSKAKIQDSGEERMINSYRDEEDLYNLLLHFIHYLYFKHLLVSPKDRRVVIVESVLCATNVRETLAKVLFHHYEVLSLFFVPSHLVSLYTLGTSTAVVIDIGFKETVVLPVYEGFTILKAWQAQPLAGEIVERELSKKLKLEHGPGDSDVKEECIQEEVIENIKVRTCFVTTAERAQKLEEIVHPPPVLYGLDGNRYIKVDGKTRESAFESLFTMDADEFSVPTMILDALLKCPVDTRKVLAENLLVIGGTSMAMGMRSRILSELKNLSNSAKYIDLLPIRTFKFHNAPAKGNFVSWLGGSIVGATEMVVSRSLTKDLYQKQKCLPDWVNLAFSNNYELKHKYFSG
ncbi:actin-related protein 10 [Ischnura elegans]|uniref:actin-related protein 10 n=1 Tax=Ischnura elegans TaxID=197161 RepID=UPI001ED8859D|nr:actin-related protein 10 [Ischnura elegans]